ncbi:hypothetical protein [Chryseobacterium sp.]|uniref:hypothetical protein n=1 Tax=Chryseobacterium sp. TaxID=1871047 RepID=UPI002FC8A25E
MIDIGFSYYFFGSDDSLDVDVMIDHPAASSLESDSQIIKILKEDFPEIDAWNINIIRIDEGQVIHSIPNKGSADSANNSLFLTYKNHSQAYEFPLKKMVERVIPISCVRCVIATLMWFKGNNLNDQYLQNIRPAILSGNWSEYLKQFLALDFSKVFTYDDTINKNILKSLAFNIGQNIALIQGEEFYTKKSLTIRFPELFPLLYRKECNPSPILGQKIQELYSLLIRENVKQIEPRKILWRGIVIDLKTGKISL